MKLIIAVMLLVVVLSCISVALATPVDSRQSFTDFRLISVAAKNEQQLGVLQKLQSDGLDEEFFDFWSAPSLSKNAEIMVSDEQFHKVMSHLEGNGLTPLVEIGNIQSLIDKSLRTAKTFQPLNFNGIVDHTKYHTLAEINGYAEQFVQAYPERVRKHVFSELTSEGREMQYLEISTDNFQGVKDAIIIEATIHAREWISPASVLYFVDRLLAESDSEAQFMLANFDWYVLLVANPDGYEYSHRSDRLWRKNRSGSGSCRGTDLNRNFNMQWGASGTSSSRCSDIYRGSAPMSEVEARNIEKLVQNVQQGGIRAKGYLAIHSYSEMILLPFSYAIGARPPNSNELDKYGRDAGVALNQVNGKNFQVGTGPTLLYPAAGGSDDWAIDRGSVRYAYTYELRPATSGAGGFVIDSSNIIPSGAELYASIHSLALSFSLE